MITHEEGFTWRGDTVSRLEAFSDTVFGFAVALLVVSVEVPKSFDQLMTAIYGFPAFAVCFALLFNLWYQHFRFFRRYALQTTTAITVTAILLFFVLFYVYPLKFLFSMVLVRGAPEISAAQARLLFVIYGLGYAAVCSAMVLLYRHAWTLRDLLNLTVIERMKTRHAMVAQAGLACIGLISALLALTLPENVIGIAGLFYSSIGIYLWITGTIFGNRVRAVLARQAADAREALPKTDQSL